MTRYGLATGDQGIRSELRTPPTTNTSSTAYLRTFVGAFKDSNNWVKVGWNAGKCGGTDQGAAPKPYFAYRFAGTTTCDPATNFLSAGAFYEFRLSYSGSNWNADYRPIGGTYVSLGTINAGFSSTVAYAAEGLEHNSAAGTPLPMPGTLVHFRNTHLKIGGSWVDWKNPLAASVKQDLALDDDVFIGVAALWSSVRISLEKPDFDVDHPASVVSPVGQQVAALIEVTANGTYDGVLGTGDAFEGPIVLDLTAIPIGTIATWEGYDERVAAGGNPLDKTYTVRPLAGQTIAVRLDILTWQPLAADGPLNFTATGKDHNNNNLTKTFSFLVDRS